MDGPSLAGFRYQVLITRVGLFNLGRAARRVGVLNAKNQKCPKRRNAPDSKSHGTLAQTALPQVLLEMHFKVCPIGWEWHERASSGVVRELLVRECRRRQLFLKKYSLFPRFSGRTLTSTMRIVVRRLQSIRHAFAPWRSLLGKAYGLFSFFGGHLLPDHFCVLPERTILGIAAQCEREEAIGSGQIAGQAVARGI